MRFSLDFEMILGIIFFVVFFVLPAFTSKNKKKNAKPPGDPAEQDQGAGQAPRRAAPPAGSEAGLGGPAPAPTASASSQRPAQPQATKTGNALEDVLAEIRARVAEAERQANAGGTTRPQAQATRAPAAQPAAPAPAPVKTHTPPRTPKPTLTSTQGSGSLVSSGPTLLRDVGTGSQPVSSLGRSGPPPVTPGSAMLDEAAPLQVSRRVGERRPRKRDLATAIGSETSAPAQKRPAASAKIATPHLSMDQRSILGGMIWHVVLSEPAYKRHVRRPTSQSRPRR